MSAPPFGKEGIGLAQTKKYTELSVRNRIISKQKYCLLLVDKYSSRWKEILIARFSVKLIGGLSTLSSAGSTFSSQSEGATSQVNDAGNDWMIQMIVTMIGCVDSDDW